MQARFYSDAVGCWICMRVVAGSIVGQGKSDWHFSSPLAFVVGQYRVDNANVVGQCSGCEQQRDCLVGPGMVPRRFGEEGEYVVGLDI